MRAEFPVEFSALNESSPNIGNLHAEHRDVSRCIRKHILVFNPPPKVKVCGPVFNSLQDIYRNHQKGSCGILFFRAECKGRVAELLATVWEREFLRKLDGKGLRTHVDSSIPSGSIAAVRQARAKIP